MKFGYTKKDTMKVKKKNLRKDNKLKISFCMTCMNRLHHVERTLEQSIIANQSYQNVEFVLLDYNSKDGLEAWVKERMMKYIESGILNYYQMDNPKPRFFNMTHAKNVAHKLGIGDILCNLDADNFVLDGAADYLMDVFWNNFDEDIFVAPCRKGFSGAGVWGRICARKKKFYKVGGYNEVWNRWGGDDHDYNMRLKMSGSKWVCHDVRYLRCINHSSIERFGKYKRINGKMMKHRTAGSRSWRKFSSYIKQYGYKANHGKHWGQANLIKNFKTLIII